MKKFQSKLAMQQAKLAMHLRNLRRFTQSPRFEYVEPEEQSMILDQISAMADFNDALISRLRFHNVQPEVFTDDEED